jgi:hypothetical protein
VVKLTRKLLRWDHAYVHEAYDLDVDPAEHVNWAPNPSRAAERVALDNELQALLDRQY